MAPNMRRCASVGPGYTRQNPEQPSIRRPTSRSPGCSAVHDRSPNSPSGRVPTAPANGGALIGYRRSPVSHRRRPTAGQHRRRSADAASPTRIAVADLLAPRYLGCVAMADRASASLLRKIDCVMIRVPDLDTGARFYEQACGLRRLWSDASSVGLAMSDTDAEIVVHTMDLPPDCGVHFLVDDVPAAVAELVGRGSRVIEAPFEIPVGTMRCAGRSVRQCAVRPRSEQGRAAPTTTRR